MPGGPHPAPCMEVEIEGKLSSDVKMRTQSHAFGTLAAVRIDARDANPDRLL